MSSTIAKGIADLFDNDCRRFTSHKTSDRIEDLCEQLSTDYDISEAGERYGFDDGSWVLISDTWRIGRLGEEP